MKFNGEQIKKLEQNPNIWTVLPNKIYKELLDANYITQSMSLPDNPKDNAVIESFFGHLKDEVNLKNVRTFEQLVEIIDNYMYYYNNEKRQWNKNRMTSIQYRDFLLAS